MSKENMSPAEREQRFHKFLVAEYLKYGSVDEVLRVHRDGLPISVSSFHRVINKWEIIKAAGPNSRLSEAIAFLTSMAEERIPLETLYGRMPPSFRSSMATMHRIYSYVKEGATRRVGTALVITAAQNPDLVLVGNDVSPPRVELGKLYGSISLPMGFSRKRDPREKGILRVLQQEVFTQQTIDRDFPFNIIPEDPRPFMYIDVVDVRVAVYHLTLPEELKGLEIFSSFKLENHRYLQTGGIVVDKSGRFRMGIAEIVSGYQRHLEMVDRNIAVSPVLEKSILNQQLLALAPLEA